MALELGVGERIDYVAQRGEALQMQGGAGRCGEIQRRASGGLIRRALSRAWLIEIASLYLPINPYISLYLAISRYISLYLPISPAWLIEIASLSVSPEAPVFDARSEPARSTRLILELVRVALPFASVSCST